MGIEAISRGAMLATFVERSARMCTFLRKNLEAMGIKDGHGEVAEIEILPFLKKAALRKRVWDIIYFDLPQADERSAILDRISLGCAINSRGLVIISHPAADEHQEKLNHLKRWRKIEHGETILTIYERI
jgi:16S rRNA G966 N2-methylase RsmD